MADKKIQCVKLITGEEVIGEVERGVGDILTLHNPIYIQMIPKQDNSGMTLMMSVQFCMYAKTRKFTFSKEAIMTYFDATTEVENAYRTNHGSGIAVVAGNTDVSEVAKKLLIS